MTVAVSLDGVLAPMRDGDAQKKREKTAEEGRLTHGPAGYREVGCGTLSFCDSEGDMISAVRIARMPETKKVTLKRTLLSDVTAALAERPDVRLVKIADGALDDWTFLANEVPGGVEILDFYHAVEHLDGALGSVYGEGTLEARKRFAALRFVLQAEADGAEKIIRALDYLRKRDPKNARVTKECRGRDGPLSRRTRAAPRADPSERSSRSTIRRALREPPSAVVIVTACSKTCPVSVLPIALNVPDDTTVKPAC